MPITGAKLRGVREVTDKKGGTLPVAGSLPHRLREAGY
jgi:hypothetical protein